MNVIASRINLGLFGLLLLLVCANVWALVAVPPLTQHVTDLTATLNPQQMTALEDKLTAFETQKGSQVVVLIIPTTEPEDIAQYGIRVAEAWKIGRKKVDDGAILIVAKEDRKLRIEVGYGLEGVIPDAVAKRVIAETITPYFKTGDFAGGIDAGVTQLTELINGEPLPPPEQPDLDQADDGRFLFILIGGVMAGCVFICLDWPYHGWVSRRVRQWRSGSFTHRHWIFIDDWIIGFFHCRHPSKPRPWLD